MKNALADHYQKRETIFMTTSRVELITALEQTRPTLIRLTSSLSDFALDFRATPGEWSIREILAHLVDDEMYVMRTRLERIIKEDQPSLAPHNEKHWYANRNKTRDTLNELLNDFAVQRAASLGIIKMLREEDWTRQGYQPEYGLFTAQEWLTNWTAHDTTHLRQIQNNLETYQAQTSA
jgi:DinB superfamily